MELQRNGKNNGDLLSDARDHAMDIFVRVDRYVAAELNKGMVWQKLASERMGDMLYSMHRLAAATLRDNPNGSDDVSPAASEGFRHNLISGVGFRCIGQADIYRWELESVWDSVEMNHIRLSEDYEWRPVMSYNAQRDVKVSMQENITVWWRGIKDWNRKDGNILSQQILWSGSFSHSERVLQLLEDLNTTNALEIIYEQVTLHPQLSEQYIALYKTNRVAGAYSAVDSSLSVAISQELVSTKGGDCDGDDGLLCAICHEMIYIGRERFIFLFLVFLVFLVTSSNVKPICLYQPH